MKVQQIYSILLILILLIQCVPAMGDMPTAEKNLKSIQSSDWLFLIYMDADNNLGSAADNNLAQMMAVGSDESINILVLLDKNGFGDSRIYNVKKNTLELVDDDGAVIPETQEVNMGSSDTLKNFLNFSMQFKRNHTFLVLWDHGSGWRGFCTDSQSKDSLNLSEIADALNDFEIDVLGIDACQGALVEVVYALRNSAKYFVGSQKDEPENGWNYTLLLNIAKATAPLTPERFATVAVEAFEKHYRSYSMLSVSVALSAINLSKVSLLVDALDNFSLALSSATFLLHSEISEARNSTETYEGNSKADVDLGDFARKSLNSSYINIRKGARNMLSALQATVLKSCGITAFLPASGVRADNTSGLSIYFPQSTFNSEYLKTQFAKEKSWHKFLLDFLNPPALQIASLYVKTRFENNTIAIENPDAAMIYICDSTGEVVTSTNITWINYTVSVCDYYEILAYNYTSYMGNFYLDGMFKNEKKWIGERRPNIKINSVEFVREDGIRILGDTGKHPVENRSFSVHVEVSNPGNVNLSTVALIEVGNFRWRENVSVSVNATGSINRTLILPVGEFKFSIFLDPDNQLRETNETDNFYLERFQVKSGAPLRGISIVLEIQGVCNYRIYNETGYVLAEGTVIGKTTAYISPSSFKEGEYLYVHLISGNQTVFRKIQVFSEDDTYKLVFNIQTDGFTVIDYVFITVVAVLLAIMLIVSGITIQMIRRNDRNKH